MSIKARSCNIAVEYLMEFTKRYWHSVLLLIVLAVSSTMSCAQVEFIGRLDGGLRLNQEGGFYEATFNLVSASIAQASGVMVKPGDKVFVGNIPLGANLNYKAFVVRQSNGTDVIYVDMNRNGHFEANERVPFRQPTIPFKYKAQKSSAEFAVKLPNGPFGSCPMIVWMLGDPAPVQPGQIEIGYTPHRFVEGSVKLPQRTLMVKFSYDFATQGISLTNGSQWLDINGDGKFDRSPGSNEFLHDNGSPPVFRVGDLTLQFESIDPKAGHFVLRKVPASSFRRIPLVVGSVLPDFEFTDFSGAQRHLSDIRGRFILLDFWATWCVPCMNDLPSLKKNYAQFHSQGFEILGMDGDSNADKPEKVVQSMGLNWTQAKLDKDLVLNRFRISQWPTMVLIDEHHKVLSIGADDHLPLFGEHLAPTLRTLMSQTP